MGRHTKARKRIQEVQTKDKYKGEASPYWNYVRAHSRGSQAPNDSRIEFIEDRYANPDLLAEEDNIFHHELSPAAQLRLDAIKEGLPQLTAKQRKVVYLCGVKDYSLAETAKIVGISRGGVQSVLNHARRKIKKIYSRLLLD